MSENRTLEAANMWQIQRALFLEKHPDQRVFFNRIEDHLQQSIWSAITMMNDFSFAIREVERKAKEDAKGDDA